MSQTVREIATRIINAPSEWPYSWQEGIHQVAAHVIASTEPLGDTELRRIESIVEIQGTFGNHDVKACLAEIRRLQAELKTRSAALEKSERERAICYGNEGALIAEIADLRAQLQAAQERLNTPEIHDFAKGVVSEAQHQRGRWGSDHDAGKLPEDWFWLLGYLAGKCLAAYKAGDTDKTLHHMISTAAAIANWHSAILGQTNMRPGLAEEKTNGIG